MKAALGIMTTDTQPKMAMEECHIGNSKIKIFGISKGSGMIQPNMATTLGYVFTDEDVPNNILKKLLKNYPSIVRCIISDVNGSITKEIESVLFPLPLIYCSSELKLPFKSKYKPFDQLGSDRIALITASVIEYPKQNILIIDLGTCITYDIINNNVFHVGGLISPGYRMRYKALNEFSGRLPLLEPEMICNRLGNNTEDAIHSGVTNGIISEIKETISHYQTEFEFLKVILTGGDAQKLPKPFKNTIFENKNFLGSLAMFCVLGSVLCVLYSVFLLVRQIRLTILSVTEGGTIV